MRKSDSVIISDAARILSEMVRDNRDLGIRIGNGPEYQEKYLSGLEGFSDWLTKNTVSTVMEAQDFIFGFIKELSENCECAENNAAIIASAALKSAQIRAERACIPKLR